MTSYIIYYLKLAAKDILAASAPKPEERLIDFDTPTKQLDSTVVSEGEISPSHQQSQQQLKDKCAKLETLLSRCKELIKTQKQNIADKDKTINEHTELLEKKKNVEKDLNDFKKRTAELELKLAGSTDLNESLQGSVDRMQKRFDDLNMELDEKGNLFQVQFQVFQKGYLDKEEGLKNKLKLLQDDYFNLENELAAVKDKNRGEKVETGSMVKSNVVELDVSKLEAEKEEAKSDNLKLKAEIDSLGNY